jgi:hypothetical protein
VKQRVLALAALALLPGAASVHAEPIFLSRQYNRCTTCHYSPTGGGLLTPYGRSLSRQELSTTGRSNPTSVTGHLGTAEPKSAHKEEDFLFGLLGDSLRPVDVGIDLRPSHLSFGGVTSDRNIFMTADLLAAWRSHGWTVYGEVGRQLRVQPDGTEAAKLDSYEHWVGYQSEGGLGFRVGRFFPAYGVRLADHTAFTRVGLGFDKYDQVYALELSRSTEHHLLQLSFGPGPADAVINDDGRKVFTATGRFQMDLNPRTVLVFSGLYRDKSTLIPSNGAGGIAFGFAPTKHISIWSEADAQFQQGTSGAPAYSLLNETGVEVIRGIWLKVSPQLRTVYGDTSGGTFRMVYEANLFPRTHWNVDVSYYRDETRTTGLVYKTFLAQLHLYL